MGSIIYLLSALAIGLFFYGIFQIRFARLEDEYHRVEARQTALFKLIEPIMQSLAAYNLKFISKEFIHKYKKKLIISGNPLRLIPEEFLALKEISAIAGFLFGLFLVFTTNVNPIFPFVLGMGVFFLPNLWVNEEITRRKHAIFIALPFSMDLLSLSVEAGLTFLSAIEEVVEKGEASPLQDEFGKLLQDMRLGVSPRDALAALAERTDMYEIRSFTSALIQADKLGTPIGEALKNQAEMRRSERFQRADKMAQEAPIKMLFPLLCFIFPAVFIIILVPILLKFMAEGM